MPQLFQVLQCYSCKTFQVYSRGNGKECRLYVQELNEKRIKLENACEILTNIDCDVCLIEEIREDMCIDQRRYDSSSDFKENLAAEESINSVHFDNSKCRLMCRGMKRHLNEEECSTSRADVSKWNEFIVTDNINTNTVGKSIDRNYTDSESNICNIGQVSISMIDKHVRQSKWDEFNESSLYAEHEDINSDSKQNGINESVITECNKRIKWNKLPESENYTNGGKNIQYKNNFFESADVDVDSVLKL